MVPGFGVGILYGWGTRYGVVFDDPDTGRFVDMGCGVQKGTKQHESLGSVTNWQPLALSS